MISKTFMFRDVAEMEELHEALIGLDTTPGLKTFRTTLGEHIKAANGIDLSRCAARGCLEPKAGFSPLCRKHAGMDK